MPRTARQTCPRQREDRAAERRNVKHEQQEHAESDDRRPRDQERTVRVLRRRGRRGRRREYVRHQRGAWFGTDPEDIPVIVDLHDVRGNRAGRKFLHPDIAVLIDLNNLIGDNQIIGLVGTSLLGLRQRRLLRDHDRLTNERNQLPADVAQMLQEHQCEERSAERDRDVEREQAAEIRPKKQRDESLNPPQVELAFAVNAIECVGEIDVCPQEHIPAEELFRSRKVRHLETIPRDRVAQVADPQITSVADAVDQLRDELVASDDLDRVRGRQARGGDCRQNDRREIVSNVVFEPMNLVVEQPVDAELRRLSQSHPKHLPVRLLEAHQDEDGPRERQQTFDRPAAERADGLG